MADPEGYIETLEHVTADRLGKVIKGFEKDGAIKVEQEAEPDGAFTVRAYFRFGDKVKLYKAS